MTAVSARGPSCTARGDIRKSNVLVIMADEHGAWATGAYGHPFVRTPNLDGLASGGVTFDRAYTPSPICVPARASFMTGLRVEHNEVWDNGVPMGSDVPTWAHYLTLGGYQTVLAGKMHFMGTDQLHGFEKRLGGEVETTRIRTVDFLKDDPSFDIASWLRVDIGRLGLDDFDEEMEAHAIRFIEGQGRDPERPFALCVSFIRPHFPLIVERPYWDMYWPEPTDVPLIPEGYIERLHPVWKRMRTSFKVDTVDEEHTRRARAAYYGLTTQVDARIGRLLAALDRAGLASDTIVIYTSDHGDHMGAHGLWWKSTFFEESVRVPLIVVWPGRLRGGERRGQICSLVDVAATMLDIAGIEPIEPLDGHSLVPVLDSAAAEWEDTTISEFYASAAPGHRAMLRERRYKLNWFPNHEPELYDLDSDPGEWHDLAADPTHRGIRDDLVTRLRERWNGELSAKKHLLSLTRRRLVMDAETMYQGKLTADDA